GGSGAGPATPGRRPRGTASSSRPTPATRPRPRRGTLFVISAPSGTGKSTLSRRLLESVPGIAFSISTTTRPRRAGEESGREYHFVDDTAFDALVASGGFLEWAHVFGRRYETGRPATE